MLNKKLMILTIILVSLLAVSTVSAADNTTSDVVGVEETTDDAVSVDGAEVVSAEDNQAIGNVGDVGTFDELSGLIGNASQGSVLELDKDYKYVDGSNEGIQINQSITIDGKGHTLDGNMLSRIFYISANHVVLKDINLINAYAENDGGAVYFKYGSTGTIENCSFANNKVASQSSGGAVYFYQGGEVRNCNFINNTAASYGGAVHFGSGSTGTIENCTFFNHIASSGSAVCFLGNGVVAKCNFANNVAWSAGSVKFFGTGTLTECNFTNNTVTYGNGGAVHFSENGEITNCNFTSNTATKGWGGAALFVGDGKVINCNFVKNTAPAYGGGAIDFRHKVTVENCNFTDCSANYGGVLYIEYGSSGTVANSNFTDFSAMGSGAICFESGTSVTIENCNFVNYDADQLNNSVNGGSLHNCKFILTESHDPAGQKLNTTAMVLADASDMHLGENVTITVYVFDENNQTIEGSVNVYLNSALIGSRTIGIPFVYLPTETGSYLVEAMFNETSNYSSSSANASFTVMPVPVTPEITVPSIDELSANGTFTVTLPADAKGTVTLTVGGKDYVFDAVNGKANVKFPELGDGDYPYTITYSGDSKYSSFTNNGSLKVNKTSVNPVENQTNSTVNPIDNKTDNNTTENNTSQENTTVIDNSKIVASNVNVVYSSGSYYTITVYGTNGELADGVNVKISGKISKSLTTSNGVAKFKVTQTPGTYKITVSALGKSVTKTITVKKATPKLTAKAKTFKKSVKTKNYVVTFKTNQNKVMKKAKLTMKVNGKTYSATTNAKGQATFKITKLTKKGKFTGTIAYKGNAYYNKLSKKVQITVK